MEDDEKIAVPLEIEHKFKDSSIIRKFKEAYCNDLNILNVSIVNYGNELYLQILVKSKKLKFLPPVFYGYPLVIISVNL